MTARRFPLILTLPLVVTTALCKLASAQESNYSSSAATAAPTAAAGPASPTGAPAPTGPTPAPAPTGHAAAPASTASVAATPAPTSAVPAPVAAPTVTTKPAVPTARVSPRAEDKPTAPPRMPAERKPFLPVTPPRAPEWKATTTPTSAPMPVPARQVEQRVAPTPATPPSPSPSPLGPAWQQIRDTRVGTPRAAFEKPPIPSPPAREPIWLGAPRPAPLPASPPAKVADVVPPAPPPEKVSPELLRRGPSLYETGRVGKMGVSEAGVQIGQTRNRDMPGESPVQNQVSDRGTPKVAPPAGVVNAAVLKREIRSRFALLKSCTVEVARHKKVPPSAVMASRLTLRWTILPEGTVTDTHVIATAPTDGEVLSCVKREMSIWSFTPPRGGPAQIERPFRFRSYGPPPTANIASAGSPAAPSASASPTPAPTQGGATAQPPATAPPAAAVVTSGPDLGKPAAATATSVAPAQAVAAPPQ